MYKSRSSVRKYVVSSTVAATIVLSPMATQGVFAQANPDQIEENNTSETSEISFLHRGDQGEGVEALQTELQSLGYYTYSLDGLFGPITEDAVEEFQADQGLKVDGLAGPNTMAALSSIEESDKEEDDEAQETEEAPESEVSASGQVDSESSEVAEVAEDLIGVPYVWGGTTPDGFDSSGFIQYAYEQAGIDLSRTHRANWSNNGEFVDSPDVGDLVFFEGTYDVDGASHSGIYVGDNKIVHAGSDGIEYADLTNDYWQDHYLGTKSFQ
ncbi:NlpC/P60 family protein [Halobacillus halophilus]|uniref:C40 family peptidase n=1 Tax=Halobacillus halophilus TaxID=1570 RepID=UPI001CD337EA|nr:NlpC/P60 family protein [Halobacillus halophilus]MCA1011730.1 NlpC/P60 family protein [Halobacillus halophilus]